MFLAPLIDSTLLDPLRSAVDVDAFCDDAVKRGYAEVCVLPRWVPHVSQRLRGGKVAVATVISHPHGGDLTETKAAAVQACAAAGADELEVVMDTAALRADDFARPASDLTMVVNVGRGVTEQLGRSVKIKAVVESGAVTQAQLKAVAEIAGDAGAQQVVAATGAGPRPASVEDMQALRGVLPATVDIKAGGVETRELAEALVDAGANRLGSSDPLALVE